ncbi:MAG TPA: hypothetical protein VM571_07765 [Noviherbaspirillum sp.]|nr:hypothetical protein [Noviherbaspirillum sp.]
MPSAPISRSASPNNTNVLHRDDDSTSKGSESAAEEGKDQNFSRPINNPQGGMPRSLQAAREELRANLSTLALSSAPERNQSPAPIPFDEASIGKLPPEVLNKIARDVWASSSLENRLKNLGNMRLACKALAESGVVPIKHAKVGTKEESEFARERFKPGGFDRARIEIDRRRRTECQAFFRNMGPLWHDREALFEKLKTELEEKGTLFVPFHVFPANDKTALSSVLRTLHRLARKVEHGTIEYSFGGAHAFGEQPHSWDCLKQLLPPYLSDLGKTVLSADSKNRPTSWTENKGMTIDIDLSGVSPKYGTFSPNFTRLMSEFGKSNLNKVTLNANTFEKNQKYWQSVSDMTCAKHPGSRLDELELKVGQTYTTTDEYPTTRFEWEDISRMAQDELAKAITNENCKLKILRLPGLYLPDDGGFLANKLQERQEKGLPDIQIFGGYQGDVPLNQMSVRAQFPKERY